MYIVFFAMFVIYLTSTQQSCLTVLLLDYNALKALSKSKIGGTDYTSSNEL